MLRTLIESYLGDADSAFAASLLSTDREEVHVRIDPARLYSWDFTERMRDVLPVLAGDPPGPAPRAPADDGSVPDGDDPATEGDVPDDAA